MPVWCRYSRDTGIREEAHRDVVPCRPVKHSCLKDKERTVRLSHHRTLLAHDRVRQRVSWTLDVGSGETASREVPTDNGCAIPPARTIGADTVWRHEMRVAFMRPEELLDPVSLVG